jgi:hypothetical protein
MGVAMKPDMRVDKLLDALRADLPSAGDVRRVRARLAAAGVAVGTGLASQTAVGSAVAAKGVLSSVWSGLSTQLGARSLISKVGLATVVAVCALGAPGVLSRRSLSRDAAQAPLVASGRLPRRSAANGAQPAAVAPNAPAAAPLPAEAPVGARLERMMAAPARSAGNLAARPRARARAADASGNGAERSAAAHRATESGQPPTAVLPPLPVVAPSASGERTVTTAEALAPSSLGQETALIDATFAALRVRDFAAAARLIAEHERRFPRGLLARERERARLRLEASSARN